MSRRILVSGACQTDSVVEALKLLLPSDEFAIVQLRRHDHVAAFDEAIAQGDFWLTATLEFTPPGFVESINPAIQILRWPQIFFPAFHPDITLAKMADGHDITSMGCVYNSSICLWAWRNGVPLETAIKLFRRETFDALGYLDRWDPSVTQLRQDFTDCELNFEQFFLPIKRQGVFMHSGLHAKLAPIVQIARLLAIKLGADRRCMDEPLENFLQDRLLFDSVWPVYPEIGAVLGVPSCYRWKYREAFCHSLDDYVTRSYADYDARPIDKATIRATALTDIFDRIMHRQWESLR